MNYTIEDVERLAHKIRDAFEEIAKSERGGQVGSLDMCGYCLRASVQLFLEGRKRGMDMRMVAAWGHVYNSFEDYIIDITATQFGVMERVMVRPKFGNQIGSWEPETDGEDILFLGGLNKVGWSARQSDTHNDAKVVARHLVDWVGCGEAIAVAANG